MKPGDFLLYTFEGDASDPPTTYEAAILSVDQANSFFTFQQVDGGPTYTFQYVTNVCGPWAGQDDQGASSSLDTHDVYTAGGTDPVAGGVALVTFSDGKKYLCAVSSNSPTTDVSFFQAPYAQMSFDVTAVTQSNWDAYPVGTSIQSIEGYVLDLDLAQAATSPNGVFSTDGWWSLATPRPAFPARIGPLIHPFAVVIHTTDITPESLPGLLSRWTSSAGNRACAHFVVGRNETEGVSQLISIFRNGSHAGGSQAGAFIAANGQQWHPNSVSVGIETHCAGGVHLVNSQWRWMEPPDDDPHGAPIPKGNPIDASDVVVSPNDASFGWHVVTDYQYQQLGLLLDCLETQLLPLPEGCVAHSNSQPPAAWAVFPTGRHVGHCSLDFYNRADPWPPTCDWLRSRG